jgi:hypothetical protein
MAVDPMKDDDSGSRYIRALLARVPEEKPHPVLGQKLGLYPLGGGNEDVLVSRPLYDLILLMLDKGTPEQQAEVARLMRTCERAPWAGP